MSVEKKFVFQKEKEKKEKFSTKSMSEKAANKIRNIKTSVVKSNRLV